MAILAWLLGATVVLALSMGWWIAMPFYLGSLSKGPKPVTTIERVITLVAGVLLAVVWWYGVLGFAPFHTHSG